MDIIPNKQNCYVTLVSLEEAIKLGVTHTKVACDEMKKSGEQALVSADPLMYIPQDLFNKTWAIRNVDVYGVDILDGGWSIPWLLIKKLEVED